jgi:hypothetical protein
MSRLLSLMAVVALLPLVGCGVAKSTSEPATATAVGHAPDTVAEDSHDHSGWWCNEHGVPEEVCALCSSDLAAEFQKNGDWCKQHDRPDSQCFICHPELEAKFAAKYEAKFGKQPPKPKS